LRSHFDHGVPAAWSKISGLPSVSGMLIAEALAQSRRGEIDESA
jgi:hypothetical protein